MFDERIVELVVILTRTKNESYESYINRVSKDTWATSIKLSDLRDNMDLTRLKTELTEKDIHRIYKYHNAYILLSNILF